jgi:ubiquitin-like modifier-activating enzyme ATG7
MQSTKDATLDQQCTVTRAGIAPIASALLVELLVSVLQHPLRGRAPATPPNTQDTTAPDETGFVHPLGVVPHTIRGFLSSFSNMQIVGSAYNHCSACSPTILAKYEEQGWDFVLQALTIKGHVEKVSGLAEVQRLAEEASLRVDWDDEDDEFEEA